MRFSEEIVREKLDQVPDNVRDIAMSNSVAETLASIAQAHGLHIDQAGILDEETLYVMLGLESTDKFVAGMRERIGLSDQEAVAIADEVNSKIFLSIRESLKNNESAIPEPSKHQILNEIENPTPVEHPISLAKEIPAFPMAREITPEKPPEKIPEKTSQEIAHGFISEKLTGTVNLTPQASTIGPTTPPTPEKPKTYAADPYREPLV